MTPNKEDYIKAIYKLRKGDELISNKEIAESLKIAPASVTEMLGKLSKQELIQYEPYRGSRLTEKGLQIAVILVRGHRLWEVFLMRYLGYSWSEAHEDAELLEHITPSRLVERLNRFLDYPSYCPHGSFIPYIDGEVKNVFLRTLDTILEGEETYIRRVTEEKELLDYLQKAGVEIGSHIKVLSIGAYEGPITLELGDNHVQISYKAACKIYVD